MGDVDSFGASVGIYRIAQTLDKKAHIVLNDVTSSMQPMVEMFRDSDDYAEDMIISRQEALERVGSNAVLVVVDVNKPSITECPALLLQYITDDLKLRSEEADCMYSGIMIDTNNFMTKTGVRTFEAAAFLRRNGADVTRVRKLFRDDAAEYKAKADAVSQAEIYRHYFAISVCKSEDVASPTVVGAQAANELLNIKGIRMGGGGHLNMAGAQLENSSIEDGIIIIKRTLDSMIEEGELDAN